MEVYLTPVLREKKPSGRPSTHSHETRVMIGRQVVNKEFSYVKAAQAYGISQGAVAACVKLYKKQNTNQRRTERTEERNQAFVNYQHQSEVKTLKQEIADLYLENQLLKKALTHFRSPKKDNGSVITSENLDQSQEAAE